MCNTARACPISRLAMVSLLWIWSGCNPPATDSDRHPIGNDMRSGGGRTAGVQGLEILHPRAALVPGSGAVYLSIVNPHPESDRLLWVETESATSAELHETRQEDGVMRMLAHPEGFEIPPESTVELEPGGRHIMLIQPDANVEAAGSIRMTLHFAKAGAIEIEVPLVEAGAAAQRMHNLEHSGGASGAHSLDGTVLR